MVEERIKNIEDRVQDSAELPPTAKSELMDILAEMRSELTAVKAEHLQKDPAPSAEPGESLNEAVGGLGGAVTELEASHPRLAELANRLAVALANMGI
jgi:hypothetical protein